MAEHVPVEARRGEGIRVIAVIVTYNSDSSIEGNIEAVLDQVDAVVAVDNGSDPETAELLRTLAARVPALMLICNETNEGLGRAQNRGIEEALAKGADWVLLLDDDSRCAPDMVTSLLAGGHALARDSRVGVLAGVPTFEERERPARFLLAGFPPRTRAVKAATLGPLYFVIASGSLIRAEALRAVGLMREPFFVDYMDVDFGLRLNRAGWTIHAVRDARFVHRLGDPVRRRIGPFMVASTNHAASRRYLMYRNRSRLWREYALVFPAWVVFDVSAAVVHLGRVVVAERDRGGKLRAAASGLLRGLFGTRAELAAGGAGNG